MFIAQLRTSKQIRQSRQDSRHDIPGQRLVSGQQLPSGIGAIDPSGHLLVLHLSTSHPISFSLASSHLETLGSHGRKLIAEPLILPCTTKAVDKLLPRRVSITILNKSALLWRTKKSTLLQDAIRRICNVSLGLLWQETAGHLSEYSNILYLSG